MRDQIRVVPEDLQLSASKVAGHAEELRARHIASDSRIGDAEAGVPAASAAALSAAVTKWQVDTTALHGFLTSHGQAMGAAASAFTTTEERNTSGVQEVGGRAVGAANPNL